MSENPEESDVSILFSLLILFMRISVLYTMSILSDGLFFRP